jgi:protein-S-isoprenylcysteine O-methyltransferase Ste14
MEDKLFELKKTIKEDWTIIPFLTCTILGFIAAILDFVYRQNFNFQVYAVAGLLLLLVGGTIRFKARLELKKKAGFGSYAGTGIVKIVKDHNLVKDGLYKHIRNPIYLGEILRNLGFVLIFSSVYGSSIVLLASVFLLFRIELKEKILLAVFGEEYEEYQRNTKKMIPYIY